MKQKKKKTKKLNNEKFNFDDEYIIGFSDSAKVVKSANAGSNNKKVIKRKSHLIKKIKTQLLHVKAIMKYLKSQNQKLQKYF